MSEASPVLLNMGAELATASGVKPSVIQQTDSASAGKGEFAAALHSVLSSAAQNTETSPVIESEIAVNPLLLNQTDDLVGQLLKQQMLQQGLMPGGKDLPAEEQELAWQSILSELDSSDPDTPRMVIASGDEGSFQINELSAEDLGLVGDDSENGPGSVMPAVEGQISVEHENPSPDEQQANDTPMPTILSASQAEQGNTKWQDGSLAAAANEALSKMTNAQATDAGQAANAAQLRSEHNDLKTQASLDQKGGELDNTLLQQTEDSVGLESGQTKQASFKEQLAKQDLTALADSSLSKGGHSNVNNSSANAMLGSSAYSTISAMNGSGAPGHSSAAVIANMTIPPQNPAWGDIIGDRVQWMANQNIQEAKIRLNPPELGLLEVRVQLGHDHQTSISFSSPHAQVRDALETAVPRLREMFGESGLTLGNVDVSHHSMSGQGQAGQHDNHNTSTPARLTNSPAESLEVSAMQRAPITTGTGMLDLYA